MPLGMKPMKIGKAGRPVTGGRPGPADCLYCRNSAISQRGKCSCRLGLKLEATTCIHFRDSRKNLANNHLTHIHARDYR